MNKNPRKIQSAIVLALLVTGTVAMIPFAVAAHPGCTDGDNEQYVPELEGRFDAIENSYFDLGCTLDREQPIIGYDRISAGWYAPSADAWQGPSIFNAAGAHGGLHELRQDLPAPVGSNNPYKGIDGFEVSIRALQFRYSPSPLELRVEVDLDHLISGQIEAFTARANDPDLSYPAWGGSDTMAIEGTDFTVYDALGNEVTDGVLRTAIISSGAIKSVKLLAANPGGSFKLHGAHLATSAPVINPWFNVDVSGPSATIFNDYDNDRTQDTNEPDLARPVSLPYANASADPAIGDDKNGDGFPDYITVCLYATYRDNMTSTEYDEAYCHDRQINDGHYGLFLRHASSFVTNSSLHPFVVVHPGTGFYVPLLELAERDESRIVPLGYFGAQDNRPAEEPGQDWGIRETLHQVRDIGPVYKFFGVDQDDIEDIVDHRHHVETWWRWDLSVEVQARNAHDLIPEPVMDQIGAAEVEDDITAVAIPDMGLGVDETPYDNPELVGIKATQGPPPITSLEDLGNRFDASQSYFEIIHHGTGHYLEVPMDEQGEADRGQPAYGYDRDGQVIWTSPAKTSYSGDTWYAWNDWFASYSNGRWTYHNGLVSAYAYPHIDGHHRPMPLDVGATQLADGYGPVTAHEAAINAVMILTTPVHKTPYSEVTLEGFVPWVNGWQSAVPLDAFTPGN